MWGKVLGGFFLGLVAVRGQERAGSVLLVHEKSNNLVHTPKDHAHQALTAEEVAETHCRMMGQTPRASFNPLPVVDHFTPPDNTLLLVMGGLGSRDTHTPYLNKLHKEHYNAPIDSNADTKNIVSVLDSRVPGFAQVSCFANENSEASLALCGTISDPSRQVLDVQRMREFNVATEHFMGPSSSQADQAFLYELQQLLDLPQQIVSHKESKGQKSNSFIVLAESLKKIEKEYGWGSEELKSAERLIDQALEQVLPQLSRALEGRLVSQLVLQSQEAPFPTFPRAHRRMQLENGTNVTSADIQNINIVTWTATGLVVTLFMVMACLLSADSGPKDSLLYAKFQADVSSSKND